MRLSDPRLVDVFLASGWHEARHVQIADWVEALESAGYEITESARAILASFGGLTVEPVYSDSQKYMPAPIRFDPMLHKWLPRPTAWERGLGLVLSPLGECYADSSLFLGSDGRLYANWDAMMQCLGESFEDSLITLLFATKRGQRLALSPSGECRPVQGP